MKLFNWFIHRNDTLIEALNDMANELQALQTAVQANNALTNAVAQQVAALNAKLADVIDPAAVQAAADQITANNTVLQGLAPQ